jgi:hypothetical protein
MLKIIKKLIKTWNSKYYYKKLENWNWVKIERSKKTIKKRLINWARQSN